MCVDRGLHDESESSMKTVMSFSLRVGYGRAPVAPRRKAMVELLHVIWERARLLAFTLDEDGEIACVEYPICPSCEGLILPDIDAEEHIAGCHGPFDA